MKKVMFSSFNFILELILEDKFQVEVERREHHDKFQVEVERREHNIFQHELLQNLISSFLILFHVKMSRLVSGPLYI